MPAKLDASAAWKPEYGRYPYCGVFSIVVSCVLFFLFLPVRLGVDHATVSRKYEDGPAWPFDAGPAGCAAAGMG